MSRVCVIGDGGWGTALGISLRRNGHEVRLWGPFPEYLDEMRRTRENTRYLPGVPLPPELTWDADPAAAARDADIAVLAVPSRFYADVMKKFAAVLPPACDLVSVTKGFAQDTHQRMTVLAEAALWRRDVAALSGPSFAEEVARGAPTAVALACRDAARAARLQQAFNHERFRVYTTDDVVGVELGGALKNVIAVAAGVSDGIGFGHNAKAALITRGLAEMARVGMAHGARAETFAGLSGVGDLLLTCTGRLSRNRGVGERIGRGEKLADILNGMRQVAEGVWNCVHARALARAVGVEAPITEETYRVLHENKDPRRAVRDLMEREPRAERDLPREQRTT